MSQPYRVSAKCGDLRLGFLFESSRRHAWREAAAAVQASPNVGDKSRCRCHIDTSGMAPGNPPPFVGDLVRDTVSTGREISS